MKHPFRTALLLTTALIVYLPGCGDDAATVGESGPSQTESDGDNGDGSLSNDLGGDALGDSAVLADSAGDIPKVDDTLTDTVKDVELKDLVNDEAQDVADDVTEAMDVTETDGSVGPATLTLDAPAANAVVPPQATLNLHGVLTGAVPPGGLIFQVTDESNAVVLSGDVTNPTDLGFAVTTPATSGSHVWHVVIVQSGSGDLVADTAFSFIVNTAPTPPVVSVSPQHPTRLDAIAATIDVPSSDAEGQAITYTYQWTVDGAASGITSDAVPAGTAKKGELWTVSVSASDGLSQSAAATASVTVANAAPTPASLAFAATAVTLDGVLAVDLVKTATDVDGDTLTLTWEWTVDGQAVPFLASQTATPLTLAQALGKPLAAGAVVAVRQLATDGETSVASDFVATTLLPGAMCPQMPPPGAHATCVENGTTAPDQICLSGTIGDGVTCLVLGGLPTDATPVIASTAEVTVTLGEAATSVDGQFDVTITDGTGQVVAALTLDGLNGVQSLSAKSNLPGLNTWTVTVRRNGLLLGARTGQFYRNTPPSAPDIAIAPNPPSAGQGLKVVLATPSADVDTGLNQTVTYSYVWSKDNQGTGNVTDTVADGLTLNGEVWSVTVTPNDGVEAGPSATTAVKVGNTPPNKPIIEVNSPTVGLLGTVAATVTNPQTVDANGDPVTVSYVWAVNGQVVSGIVGAQVDVPALAAAGANVVVGAVVTVTAVATDGFTPVESASIDVSVVAGDAVCTSTSSPCAPGALCTENNSLSPVCACAPGTFGNGIVCATAKFPSPAVSGATAQVIAGVSVGPHAPTGLVVLLYDDGGVLLDNAPAQPGAINLVGTLAAGDHLWTVRVVDALEATQAQTDGPVFGDTPPSAPVVLAGPSTPTTETGLLVQSAVATDPDVGQTLVYSYAWLKDGLPTGIATAAVSPGIAKRGEVWTVIVTAFDGIAAGPTGQASITVENAPPAAFTATLTPDKVGLLGTATVNLSPDVTADSDGDPLTFTVQWFADGESVPGQAGLSLNLATIALPSGHPIKVGSFINATVTVSDGFAQASAETAPIPVEGTGTDVCATFNPCAATAICLNNDTSTPSCVCKNGYTGDGLTCTDVDECATNNGGCSGLVTCTNTPGSFTCGACPVGYTGDGTTCVDVNECLVNNGGCSPLVTCTNSAGSSSCGACPSGFTGDGVTCSDVNECLVNNGGCDPLTDCSNTAGSFSCGGCPAGYTGSGALGCVDVNECAVGNGGCNALVVCTNTPGGHACGGCPTGYTGNGVTCSDINECAVNNGGCSNLVTCTNTAGGFTCGTCPAGYTGNGTTCTDVNECLTDNGGCDPLTACTNTVGGSTCSACPSGYTGTGADGCTDINECASNNGGCSVLAGCVNTPGSHTCGPCPAGYTGNGVLHGRQRMQGEQRRLQQSGDLHEHGRQLRLWRVPDRLHRQRRDVRGRQRMHDQQRRLRRADDVHELRRQLHVRCLPGRLHRHRRSRLQRHQRVQQQQWRLQQPRRLHEHTGQLRLRFMPQRLHGQRRDVFRRQRMRGEQRWLQQSRHVHQHDWQLCVRCVS